MLLYGNLSNLIGHVPNEVGMCAEFESVGGQKSP